MHDATQQQTLREWKRTSQGQDECKCIEELESRTVFRNRRGTSIASTEQQVLARFGVARVGNENIRNTELALPQAESTPLARTRKGIVEVDTGIKVHKVQYSEHESSEVRMNTTLSGLIAASGATRWKPVNDDEFRIFIIKRVCMHHRTT